jgi:hypothetical protein
MAIDKAALLAKRFGVEDVEIEGVGTVQIRALSRAEALELQGRELTVAQMEQTLLAKAMVSPQLTEDDVAEWQKNSPAGELQPVVEKITALSGMEQHAAKAAYADFRE